MTANVESIFTAERPAWHGLGTFREEQATRDEILELSDTGWGVSKTYLAPVDENGIPISGPAEREFTIVRDTDLKTLGTVGKNYTPIQNDEAADFAANLLDVGGGIFDVGGALDGGRIVWYSLQVPHDVQVGGVADETLQTFLNVINYHDGSGAFKAIISPIRVVCQNTLHASLKNVQTSFSIRHTSNAKTRIEEARRALKLTYSTVDAFQAELETLLEQDANADTVEKVAEEIWTPPKPDENGEVPQKAKTRWDNRLSEIIDVWQKSPNLENVRKTKYGVYNAYVEWAQWGRNFRGTEGDPAKVAEKRPFEALEGSVKRIGEEAYKVLATA